MGGFYASKIGVLASKYITTIDFTYMATTDIFSTFMRSFHKFCTQFSFDTYALIYFYDMDQKKDLAIFYVYQPITFSSWKKVLLLERVCEKKRYHVRRCP